MRTKLFMTLTILAILLAGSMSADTFIADDADGDGVPDSVDVCPAEDASYFDRDGDGCIDALTGARHIEYWGNADTVITYVINETGYPGIGDGSDFAAVQSAMNTWPAIPNTDLVVNYGGTTPLGVGAGLDQINLVSFIDNEYPFPSSVLAVGIATSFTVDSLYNGRLYRPGEIVDADMLFNPAKNFTTTGGLGSDVHAVAAHEGGHFYAISHSPYKRATMHYVLPPELEARTLESDDQLVFLKAYPDMAALTNANIISGTVTIGGTVSDPLPGAIVFIIDSATGDTTATDYTLPDGSYTFIGLPDGAYYVSIYPLNGSSAINYIQPGYINSLVEATAITLFVPEYWDLAESAADNAADKDIVTVAGGTDAVVDIISNIDITPPTVATISPENADTGVRIDAAMLIQFSEAIDAGTLSNNFRLRALDGPHAGNLLGGNAVILNDDSVVAFTPSTPYDFDVQYQLTLNTDSTAIADLFGNQMAAIFVSAFTTQEEPPLSLSSLAPNKGVGGSTIVINGAGFGFVDGPDTLIVTFNGVSASISARSPNRLVVTVPQASVTGPVQVLNGFDVSNTLTFTVLSDVEIARGFEVGVTDLGSTPNAVEVTSDGGHAYVATDGGASAVIVDAGLAGYLDDTPISITGGLDNLAITPDRKRVYGVSRSAQAIQVIDSDPADGPLFNQVLNTIPARTEPLGIVIEPTGRRAFVTTPDSVVQVWDINLESATYQRQVSVIEIADANLRGGMAITPAGDKLLALSGLGNLYVCDLGPDTLLATIAVGPDPYDVVVDPAGQRAYVTDRNGSISVVRLDTNAWVEDITMGGAVHGVTITPAGQWIYSADRQLNHIDVVDLNEENPTFRSIAATIDQPLNPVDIVASPDGFYAYSVVQADKQLIATAIGLGPFVKSLSKRAGNPGHVLVINGGGFIDGGSDVDFNGTLVQPEHNSGSSLIVRVPPGATSGPVRVKITDEVPPYESYSNSIFYQILGPTPISANIRLAARTAPSSGTGFTDAMAVSPLGDLALMGGNNGEIYMLDIDPASSSFNQFINIVAPLNCCSEDIAISPDGKMAFVVSGEESQVPVLNINQNSRTFGKLLGFVASDSVAWGSPGLVRISPSGELGIVYDYGTNNFHVFDLVEGSPTFLEVTHIVPMSNVKGFEIAPDGLKAVVMELGVPGIWSLVLDPFHASFMQLTSNLPFGGAPVPLPWSAGFYPDGDSVLVWAVDAITPDRIMLQFRTDIVDNFLPMKSLSSWPAISSVTTEQVRMSPRGDRMILDFTQDAFRFYELIEGEGSFVQQGFWSGPENQSYFGTAWTPDASRFYASSLYSDSLLIFDFTGAQVLVQVSGSYQNGVVGTTLPAPFVVRATDNNSNPAAGVPVTFVVTSGGGAFPTDEFDQSTIVVATDTDGYAEVDFKLGSAPGTATVEARANGLTGSPRTFIAGAVTDPSTLPLQFAQILPVNNAADVSVTTAVLLTFTRAVDVATISDATLFLHESGDPTPIPVFYGFTDGGRKVSLTPVSTLDYNTGYAVDFTAGILDTDTGVLQNPGSRTFTTGSPPAPSLASIAPPSGTTLITVTLSGAGFDPVLSNNTVLFNSVPATPTAGGVSSLQVTVPTTATAGLVRVAVGSDTTNALPFNVLIPSTTTVDDVIASVSSGPGTKTVTMSPDGSIAYTASGESDTVIPIGVDSLVTYPAIPVGDQPVAIVIHPEGTFAYVANFGSSSMSIIGTVPGSPDFHLVTTTLVVGANPIDVAVAPDGSRVFVANSGAMSLSVIDGDSTSSTHNALIATVSVGKGTKTVTMSPDGGILYVGTDDSIEIIESLGYALIASVSTGKGTKTVTVSPDGGLLFVVTTEGDVLVVDVEPGSATANNVIASVSTAKGTKTVTMSPDGGLLYLIQEDSDEVIVVSVETVGSVSVIEPAVVLPPKTVNIAFVDTIQTGNNPEALVFDPTGSGTFLILTSGDEKVTKYGEASKEYAAYIRVTPRTLNLQSRGRYVTGQIELSPPATVDVHDIDLSSILLQDAIPIVPGSEEFYDDDGDGVDDLFVKFDRALFQAVMPQGEYVPVTITGNADIHTFTGLDTIRTIRPQVVHPKGGEVFTAGTIVDIQWTSPGGARIDYIDVHYSIDDGLSWMPIAERVPDSGEVAWVAPIVNSDVCRVMVTLYRDDEPIGMGMSPEAFAVNMPVAVALTSFEAGLEEGGAVLRWQTGLEIGTTGFNVLRSEFENGGYGRVNKQLIDASGEVSGGAYEYRDNAVKPNRTYYYKLEEVVATGSGQTYGPYEVVYRLSFDLEQNVPNPFNPSTTIRFSVANDSNVRLIVYDVAGRRVRTLVDQNKRANVYKIVWDGTNDAGQSVATGVYFYRITAGKFVQTKKMLLLK